MRKGQKRDFAHRLRHDMTDAERMLWRRLRSRELIGWKFRRQHPVGRYIVDFICLEIGLVVELDGGQHAESHSDTNGTTLSSVPEFRHSREGGNPVPSGH